MSVCIKKDHTYCRKIIQISNIIQISYLLQKLNVDWSLTIQLLKYDISGAERGEVWAISYKILHRPVPWREHSNIASTWWKQWSTHGRILKVLLYGELTTCKRSQVWPHLSSKDICKNDMRAMDIEWWEDDASDRSCWRCGVHQRLEWGEKLWKRFVKVRHA